MSAALSIVLGEGGEKGETQQKDPEKHEGLGVSERREGGEGGGLNSSPQRMTSEIHGKKR